MGTPPAFPHRSHGIAVKLKFFRRKGYSIRGPRDIGPLILRVLLHWKVPRMEIQVEQFALLDA